MDLLDLVISVAALVAVLGGYRLGFLARATSWVGLALGLLLAARFLPRIVDGIHGASPANRQLVVIGSLVGAAFAGQALGLVLGSSLRRALPFGPPRVADRLAGACAGLLGVGVAIWLVLPSMANVPGFWAQQTRNSTLARLIDSFPVRPPDTLQALRRLVGNDAFPRVFEALRPSLDTGPPPADSGLPAAVVARVSVSAVKVEGIACGRIQDGSGFVAAPDEVVTNAHVVAGERQTTVITSDGRRERAVVALFDPNRDLALLRVRGLSEPPLVIGHALEGQTGAVFGHPGGQARLAVAPAAIRQAIVAVGRDLYDQGSTRRRVFILASDLHPGDSGGPLVDHDGAAVGVAFAIAPDRPGTAYALTSDELAPVLAQGDVGQVGTGPCLTSA
ncbi:MAG: MarP family serine protease [Acidimicrobiales bacterium]